MCIKNLSYITETYLWSNAQRKETGRKMHMSSILRIGIIPTIQELFSLRTREWDRRGDLGLEPVKNELKIIRREAFLADNNYVMKERDCD